MTYNHQHAKSDDGKRQQRDDEQAVVVRNQLGFAANLDQGEQAEVRELKPVGNGEHGVREQDLVLAGDGACDLHRGVSNASLCLAEQSFGLHQ